MCDGRYDTPEHRLFKDLDTVFKDDFHNPTFPVSSLPSIFSLSNYSYVVNSLAEFCTLVLTRFKLTSLNNHRLISLDPDSHGTTYIVKLRVLLHMIYLQTLNRDGENQQNGKSVSEGL